MPGSHPTQSEAMTMAVAQVMGNDVTIAWLAHQVTLSTL